MGTKSPLSLDKFLFRVVGDTFLLGKSTRGLAVHPIPESELEEQLKMPLDQLIRDPKLLMQTMLDHNHGSYSHDLLIAARLQAKREMRQLAAH